MKDISRFEAPHHKDFNKALQEIRNGKKLTHWMWYIFPQLEALGKSETAKFYGIEDRREAEAFLQHPLLGKNLITISEAMLALPGNNATAVLGQPDDMKLQSCTTLFAQLKDAPPVFQQLLDKYYGGRPDGNTQTLLRSE